jgi:tetratricopeptide (TPR) repeat protein
MTTAKVAIKNGDNAKAIENLQKEIEKNPKNGEAYILLAELKQKQGDLQGAIDMMSKAEPLVANNPTLKDRPAQFKFNVFKKSVEDGGEAFNKYSNNTKNTKQLDNAIKHFTTAVTLRPNFLEGWRRIGLANEMLEKDDEAMAAYEEYLKVLQPSIDCAIANNFFVDYETKKLSQQLGKSSLLRGTKLTNGDSLILEKYVVEGKDLFIQSMMKSGGVARVESWSYNPPTNILDGEREFVPDNITQPMTSLAQMYYRKKDKDNSLKYFKIASSINPNDVDANSAIVTLYQEMGRGDEAIKTINDNVVKNPDNPVFVAQLGDVYMNKGDFDNAISQYEKALTIDPSFSAALRNAAACYGNKAAKIQSEQQELLNTGKIKAVDVNTYASFLEKAADYFKRCLETKTFKDDPDVMGDLCGIYLVLLPKEKANFDKSLADFEALEGRLTTDKKEQYYLKLLKIYGQTKNPKYSDVEQKFNALDK